MDALARERRRGHATHQDNGYPVPYYDWRGNRLADLAAKAAVAHLRVKGVELERLDTAITLVETMLVRIGQANYAANNCTQNQTLGIWSSQKVLQVRQGRK